MLSIVGGNLWIKLLGYSVKRDAVVRLDHKLFLQPELFLKLLQLARKSMICLRFYG